MLSTPQRLWQVLKSNPQREESLLTETADIAVPDDRGLFVIGAARSGTTVFQNALNSSPEIFLLGEPALQDDPGTPDFAARYNAMHRSWGNQENKSSFCPPLFDQDAPWHHYLARLARHYRYVGSKIVVNPHEAARTCQQLFEFHCRHFYRSHYVFTFRNPIDVLMSTRGLAELNGDEAAGYDTVLKSFLQVMALYIRFLRNLPSVRAVFHEDLGEAVLRDTGAWLGVDLGEAAGYVLTLPDKRTIYLAGDTNVFTDMSLIQQLYKPSLAFLPIGDYYTMSPHEASAACRLLGAAKVVPLHFGTFPALTGRPEELAALIADTSTEVWTLEPGKPVSW